MNKNFEVRKVFRQSGKSLAVVIPSEYAETLKLENGCYVRVFLKESCLVIEPLKQVAQEV